jgi:hypothetical protein
MGLDVFHDRHGVACAMLHKYHKVVDICEHVFSPNSKQNVTSSLEQGNCLKLDTNDLSAEEGTMQYQPRVGELQLIISMDQFGITTQVKVTSSFHIPSCCGYLKQTKGIIEYLVRMISSCTCVVLIPGDIIDQDQSQKTTDNPGSQLLINAFFQQKKLLEKHWDKGCSDNIFPFC